MDDSCARLGVHDVPHLGLAGFAEPMCGRVVVVGVHLNRECVTRVEELDQEREFTTGNGGLATAADQPRPELGHEAGQIPASQRAPVHHRHARGMPGYLPAFGDDTVGQLAPEQAFELTTSPEVVLEPGRKCQGR
ncbi:MAG: hypothetical protein OXK77_17680 [Gemmatimonadota bacterium]|nr:hypothetical protein [Gemmatimonadota bacterium]MDE2866737.1 hypothetical protein [Gemmatimonadota bacterium]